MLHASTDILVPDARALLRDLCTYFAEHGEAVHDERGGRVRLDFGTARLLAEGPRLRVDAESDDETGLAYMKMGLAEHVLSLSPAPAPLIRWCGDGAGRTVPPFFREMRVVDAWTLTPHMRRVRLAGERLARFATGGLHVRLILPPAGRAPVWPRLGEDGRIRWPAAEDALEQRIYTIRRIDVENGFVDVDIVLHEGDETPGSRFARQAAPGDLVGMTGPGGGDRPNASALLLLGDETALPAIARILEDLPAEATARVLVEVDGPADELPLATDARASVAWLHRRGRPAGTCGLLPAALRAIASTDLPDGVFVWAGCEFSDFRAIRAHLRGVWKLPRERHLAMSYWRRGVAEGG